MKAWAETLMDIGALAVLSIGARAFVGLPPINDNSITFAVAAFALLTAHRANGKSKL